jgi:hypothetical protein
MTSTLTEQLKEASISKDTCHLFESQYAMCLFPCGDLHLMHWNCTNGRKRLWCCCNSVAAGSSTTWTFSHRYWQGCNPDCCSTPPSAQTGSPVSIDTCTHGQHSLLFLLLHKRACQSLLPWDSPVVACAVLPAELACCFVFGSAGGGGCTSLAHARQCCTPSNHLCYVAAAVWYVQLCCWCCRDPRALPA